MTAFDSRPYLSISLLLFRLTTATALAMAMPGGARWAETVAAMDDNNQMASTTNRHLRSAVSGPPQFYWRDLKIADYCHPNGGAAALSGFVVASGSGMADGQCPPTLGLSTSTPRLQQGLVWNHNCLSPVPLV